MTEQIPDSCVFRGRKWVIESMDGNIEVFPTNETLGIETVGTSSNNWSGRINHFIVHRGRLFLFKIKVDLAEASRDVLPPGARREIILRYEPWSIVDSLGTRTEMREFRTENLVFDDLPLLFDGTLWLSYPYSDDWECPTAGEPDEAPERIALEFEEGRLTASRELADLRGRDPARRPSGGPNEWSIIRQLAHRAGRRIAGRVAQELHLLKHTMSGELETTWEEICVQVQGEHSAFWSAYELTTDQVIWGVLEKVPPYQLEALWLQTDGGQDWLAEREETPVAATGVNRDEIVACLRTEYVFPLAQDWSNANIRGFFERRYERD